MDENDEFMRIALGNDDDPMKPDFRKVLGLWIASMTPEHRARMDKRILDQFTDDIPRDTALLQLRDFINDHAPQAKMGIQIYADSPAINYQIEANKEPAYWMGAINAVTKDLAYRLCEHCGKPFVYKSKRATYCSDVCRTAASRERRS